MPRTIDLFLDSDQPLDQLASRLSQLCGRRFVPSPDRAAYVLQDGPVVAHLSAHDFVDDDGLPLSEFRYVVSSTVTLGAELEATPELATLRQLRRALEDDRSGITCLLVLDLERPDPGDCQPNAGDHG